MKTEIDTAVQPVIPDVRFFEVRRIKWANPTRFVPPVLLEGLLESEGIEAHKIEPHANGSVSFIRYTSAEITDAGTLYTYRLEKLLAPGTYHDIREVTEMFQPKVVN